jgi:hypothetical protein
MDNTLKKLCDLMFGLMKGNFYGSLTINLQGGKIVNIEKKESIKF